MEAGRDRQRQVEAGEAGKLVGNVPSMYIHSNVLSMYILFISYQFCILLVNWFCVYFYSKLVSCTLVQ